MFANESPGPGGTRDERKKTYPDFKILFDDK